MEKIMTAKLEILANLFCSRCGMPLERRVDQFGNIIVEPCRQCVAKEVEKQRRREAA
jgi:hypothetical protein